MTYGHVIHTSWLVGPNYNEAPVFTSKSIQNLFNSTQGRAIYEHFGNETNLEADYETQVVTSHHLCEYTRHVMKNAMIMPHLNI